jgi:hypothetical protein
MFPGAGASIDYNSEGEVMGWDYPSDPDEDFDQSKYYDDESDYEPTYDVVNIEGVWLISERDDDQGEFDSLTDAQTALYQK